MIRLDDVSKFFGQRALFSGLSLRLDPGRRVGLVGPNGSGKTTLFRLITGETEPDGGRVIRPAGCRVGHLPQDVGDIGDDALIDHVMSGRPEILAIEQRLEQLHIDFDAAPDPDTQHRLGDEMGHLTDELHALGGYGLRARAQSVLTGMGFRTELHERPATELSGGWRVRLVLCRLLLQRPDVLLLDEPTNHLDVPSVEWLEQFLASYEGTVVVISHDRYFLNRLVDQIAAFEPEGLYVQDGDYDAYEGGLVDRAEALAKARARQEREIAHLERFIARFRAKATKAKQVQSRVKRLEKLDRVEIGQKRKKVRRFGFSEAPREGKEVVVLEGAAKAYGDTVVYSNLDFSIFRGERVALVGPNGEGKSTLLKLMVGETSLDAGRAETGHNVMPAYFGQHQLEELDLSRTLLQEMEAYATIESMPRCRSVLGAFLFSGDDVTKKVVVLSGGEKNRLAMAKLLLRPTNFLVLDEPTNHLDMESRDTLLEALEEFPGTIVFVSHDRYFIDGLATRVVHVEGGGALTYDGDYTYYRAKRAEEQAAGAAPAAVETRRPTDARKDRRRRDAELRRELKRRLGDRPKRLDALESEISGFEQRSREVEVLLADPAVYDGSAGHDVSALLTDFDALRGRLERRYRRWEKLTEEIEKIEREVRAQYD